MNKFTAKFFFILVSTFIFSSGVAVADQCPANMSCSNSMPIVPEFKNPLATSNAQSQGNTLTVPSLSVPTIPLTVPTIPVTAQKVEIPVIEVPSLKAPESITGNPASAQSVPTIIVPEFKWPDKAAPSIEDATPSPAYPTPTKKITNKGNSNESKPSTNTTVEEVLPTAAFPLDEPNGSSLPITSLVFLGLGALMAVSYNAVKDRKMVTKSE